ncbi:hypothetical protein CCM_06207 [Cordyceps militaris CM01]|uniref:Uncharacterized protein n=1 Tax=Cordyceps militaris (strain CM01) TaxID=983644 RepID=G3JJF9_CORMM|nr:uncharacterized protein CCM_06207 [Cordyceps militaris CM01]EGX92047.1 hypothetical protein CCM_06207 [Cordyceps militaris CM01]
MFFFINRGTLQFLPKIVLVILLVLLYSDLLGEYSTNKTQGSKHYCNDPDGLQCFVFPVDPDEEFWRAM